MRDVFAQVSSQSRERIAQGGCDCALLLIKVRRQEAKKSAKRPRVESAGAREKTARCALCEACYRILLHGFGMSST